MFEQYTATKLTSRDKRGGSIPAKRDCYNDRRGMLPPVSVRTKAEIKDAQLVLAGLALEQDDPEQWLSEMLAILGITEE